MRRLNGAFAVINNALFRRTMEDLSFTNKVWYSNHKRRGRLSKSLLQI